MDHGSAPMETPFMARKQGSLVVNELDCQSSRFKSILGVQIQARVETWTVHCKWEDETVKEKTGHPPSYAVAKKMKWQYFLPIATLGLA